MLSKYESVKIYCLSVEFDWFKWLKRGYCKSVKFHWMLQWKLTDSTVKIFFPLIQLVIINWFNNEIYFLTGESLKRQITDSISKNLTDSDLESDEGSDQSRNVWLASSFLFMTLKPVYVNTTCIINGWYNSWF